MFGENPDEREMSDQDKEVSFAHKSVFQRFSIVVAGPLFNLLFSVFLFFMVFAFVGVPTSIDSTTVGKITVDSPAEQGGLKQGDVILQINDRKTEGWLDVLEAVKSSEGKELAIVVGRSSSKLLFHVTPAIDTVKNIYGEEVEQRFMIGIMKNDDFSYNNVGIVGALNNAVQQTWMYVQLTVMGFVKIFQRVVPASELGGPILIAQIAGEQMKAGWINLIYFMGLLSVNLGILNLLPIPVLDGGHLVFLTLEGLRRKPVAERAQIVAQQVGIGLLGSLMIFVFYNDIARLFN